jgi:hypothetical protein
MVAERIVLTLAPEGGKRWAGTDPSARLRRLLKAALRSFGFRVVAIAPAVPADLQSADETSHPSEQKGPRHDGAAASLHRVTNGRP